MSVLLDESGRWIRDGEPVDMSPGLASAYLRAAQVIARQHQLQNRLPADDRDVAAYLGWDVKRTVLARELAEAFYHQISPVKPIKPGRAAAIR